MRLDIAIPVRLLTPGRSDDGFPSYGIVVEHFEDRLTHAAGTPANVCEQEGLMAQDPAEAETVQPSDVAPLRQLLVEERLPASLSLGRDCE